MTLGRFFAAALVSIGVVLGTVTVIAQCFLPIGTQVIDPSRVYANGGNSFQIASTLKPEWPLFFEIRSDQSAYPRQSNLIVLEDGRPLGPPHSVHLDIKEKGSGRYSHWAWSTGSMVIFSTSDNSDPRTNGRRYDIAARPVPLSYCAGSVLLLPLFLLALQRLLFPQFDLTIGLMTGISVVTVMVWGSFFFDQVTIAPDSISYIGWWHLVPLGYPLFLSGVRAVFGTLGWAGAIQITFLVSACIFLAFSVKDIEQVRSIEVAVFLLLLCYIPMFWYAGYLLSEALFVPLILLNLAAAFHLIAQQRVRYALVLAITAALILFVRPAGYYIPIGIIFLLIAQRGRARWTLKWACLPFAVCAIATLLINVSVRGNSTPSQMGRVLFPTVAFLFEPQFVTGPYRELVPTIEEALKPHREVYGNTSERAARVAYLTDDYNFRLLAMDMALDEKMAVREKCGASGRRCWFELKEPVYLSLFISTIVNRPFGYANLVFEQIVEAWRTGILIASDPFGSKYLAEANDLPTRLELIQKWGVPLADEEVRLRPDLLDGFAGQFVEMFDAGYRFIREQRWLVYLIGIVTLMAIPIAIFFCRDSIYWLALGYCGVVIHGSILLAAAVTVFIPRYAVPVDPMILVSGAIIIGGLILWSFSKIKQIKFVTMGTGLLKEISDVSIGVRIAPKDTGQEKAWALRGVPPRTGNHQRG